MEEQKTKKKMVNEEIDKDPVEGMYAAITYAKKAIVTELINQKMVKKDTTIEHITWTPLLGRKNTEHIKCLGQVIGYTVGSIEDAQINSRRNPEMAKTLQARASYYHLRVDYDEDKGAHINYGTNDRQHKNFVRAVKITFSDIDMNFRYGNSSENAVITTMFELTKKHLREDDIPEKDMGEVRELMRHDSVNNRLLHVSSCGSNRSSFHYHAPKEVTVGSDDSPSSYQGNSNN